MAWAVAAGDDLVHDADGSRGAELGIAILRVLGKMIFDLLQDAGESGEFGAFGLARTPT